MKQASKTEVKEFSLMPTMALLVGYQLASFVVRNTIGTATYSIIAGVVVGIAAYWLVGKTIDKRTVTDERMKTIELQGWKTAYAAVFVALALATFYEDATGTILGTIVLLPAAIIVSGLVFLIYIQVKKNE